MLPTCIPGYVDAAADAGSVGRRRGEDNMGNNCSEQCENYGKPGCKCALKAKLSALKPADEEESHRDAP